MRDMIRIAIIGATAAALCACPAVYRKHCRADVCDTVILGL